MGRVRIVLQSEDVCTSELYEVAKYVLSPDTPVSDEDLDKTLDCYDVIIVPDDEEMPDLS